MKLAALGALLAAITLTASGPAARAATATDLEFYTGEDLALQCSPPAAADTDARLRLARCGGYVMGVSDAIQASQGAGAMGIVCIPTGTDATQLIQTVQRFIDAHPDKRHFAAKDLVTEALSASYACK